MNMLRVGLTGTALVVAGMLALPTLAVAAPQPQDGVGTPTNCATAEANLALAQSRYELDESRGAGQAVLAADRAIVNAAYLLVVKYCG